MTDLQRLLEYLDRAAERRRGCVVIPFPCRAAGKVAASRRRGARVICFAAWRKKLRRCH